MSSEGDVSERYRVLVVDDEPIVHGMIARIVDGSSLPLTISGFATSAEQALEMAVELRPQICVLDILMREVNGLELGNQLRDALDDRPLLIYLTAHRSFEYAQKAIRLGAVDYLIKPIRRQDVLDTLGRAVKVLEAERLDTLEKERLKDYLGSVLPAVVPSGGPAARSRGESIARGVRDFVDVHYAEHLTLATVADHLNLSAGYVGSLFKAEYGISVKAYLRRVRIARAKSLMNDPRLNLSEIASRVGYDDISYFSQSFLDETGVRPSEYRGEGRRWPK